jgi:hypothetical protein
MNKYELKFFVSVLVVLVNLIILGITGWLVFFKGFSGWWFLLSICFMYYIKTGKCEKCGYDPYE